MGCVWDVKYAPFGATTYVWSNPAVMNARFPGQWFQIESGLAYNWHRHYDPTLGRYLQPDPLLSDESGPTVNGLPADTLSASYGSDGRAIAKSMGWKEAHDIIMNWAPRRPMMQDGPSVFGYAGQGPMVYVDPTGLQPKDKRFGLPKLFWRWYHQCIKQPGDPDLDYDGACYWHQQWCIEGKPKV